jgi:hypothetical protein
MGISEQCILPQVAWPFRVQSRLAIKHRRENMKRPELDKLEGLKLSGAMKQAVTLGRFSKDAAVVLNRREQRKLDQAQGLVPFAVKLDFDLVKQIHALAQERNVGLNDVVAELLKKGLAACRT